MPHPDVAKVVKEELPVPQEAGEGRHEEVDRQPRLFRSGGQFDQFAEGLVPRMQTEAINRRGQKGPAIGEDIDDVAAKDARAVG